MARYFALLLFCFSILGLTAQGFAQQQDRESTLLPEIDPRDIEIRSQFKARFPGLRRQPILGFDPTPRVYQVDPGRVPFMETQEQRVANLPVSELTRPEAPDYRPLYYASDIKAFGKAGFGSYTTPEMQLWGVHRFESGSYVGGDLDFSSSEGHLDNQPSSFRFLEANGEYATSLDDNTVLHLNINGQSDVHHLFEPAVQLPVTGMLGKSYFGLGFTSDIRRYKNAVEGWSVSAGARYFDIRLEDPILGNDINETVYRASFTKQWAGSHVSEVFGFNILANSGVFGPDGNQNGWTTLKAGAEYARLFNYSTRVSAEANIFYLTNPAETKVYFGPRLVIKHSFNDKLKVTGTAKAAPSLKTLEEHHEFNRFLADNTPLRHAYDIKMEGEVSYEYYRGSTIQGGIQFVRSRDTPVYSRQQTFSPFTPVSTRYYQLTYSDTKTLKAYAGFTHQLKPEKFWVSGRAYVQNPTLDSGGRVPFREKWGVNGSFSVRPVTRVTVSSWADYVGSRQTAVAGESVAGFLLVGAQIDVKITERFGAYLKGVNLLNEDYEVWKGYTERPIQFFGGLTLKLK